MTLIRDIRLELTMWGTIPESHVFLADQEIGYWKPVKNKRYVYFRELKSFSVTNPLDVTITGKGKNGSKVTLSLMIEGKPEKLIECIIQDGFTSVTETITIKENQP